MSFKAAFPAAAFLVLAACEGGGQAENTADRLEEAAEQSDPAAAPILENAADAVREGDANAQQALQQVAGLLERPCPAVARLSAEAMKGGGGHRAGFRAGALARKGLRPGLTARLCRL